MATRKNYIIPVAIHPGETLKEWLDENNMTSAEFASRSNKPPKTISLILHGKSSITPETAQAFSIVTGIQVQSWLKLQALYNEAIARQESLSPMQKLWQEWGAIFPYADMVKKGWIEKETKEEDKMEAILKFFGLTAEKAFNEAYLNNFSGVYFRATGRSQRTDYGVSAWIRQGERLAQQIETGAYDPKKAKDQIPLFKDAINRSDLKWLKELCKEAGIKLVFVENIPSASMSGAAMWKNKTPLIILSGKGKSLDKLAFNFFHELGHILLGHCNKTIFVDDIEDRLEAREEEEAANTFSSNILFSAEGLSVVENSPSQANIWWYARKANIHPCIVLGHLTHIKKVTYQEAGSKYKQLQKSIEIDYEKQC
mgnify:CR=1 FL=1|jgi:addiction module HigA family antidote